MTQLTRQELMRRIHLIKASFHWQTRRSTWYTSNMNTPQQVPLSPEQLAAVRAGEGYAHLVDPNTQQVYFLTEPVTPTIDDNYVREKLDQAQASIDRGEVADWDVDDIKAEVRQRRAGKRKN